MAAKKMIDPSDASPADNVNPQDSGSCTLRIPNPGCRCYAAVCKAYNGMRTFGVSDVDALYAAMRVYRHHHPEVDEPLARQTIESWVYRSGMH